MTGEAHWLTLAFLVGGAGVVLMLGWLANRAASAGPGRHYESRTIVCPGTGWTVDATFIREDHNGKWARVARCPVFSDPEKIRCAEGCVDELNRVDVPLAALEPKGRRP